MATVYETLAAQAEARHLRVLGGFHANQSDDLPDGYETILMIGPGEPGFWPEFTASPEYSDGEPDPVDRWSKRVLGGWAEQIGATAIYPSDGPPYAPFIAWAKATGRTHNSPAGILVQDQAGLMVSFRGALAIVGRIALPPAPPSPCESCIDRPCLTACPVGALAEGQDYDAPRCKAHLDTPEGQDCMTRGCAVRRACPVSQSYGRQEAQSAFHMRSFHPS